MRIKFVAAIVAVLSAVAAFQLAPGANADSVPEAPDGVAVRASGAGVLLSWNAVDGADAYNVYKGGSYKTTVNAPVTSHLDPGLTAATYYVTACTGKGEATRCSSSSASRAQGVTWISTHGSRPSTEANGSASNGPSGQDENGSSTGPSQATPAGPDASSDGQIDESVPGPTNLQGQAELNICTNWNTVTLTWDAPELSVKHYRVYRIKDGQAVEVNSSNRPTDTTYTYESVGVGTVTYEVRAYRQIDISSGARFGADSRVHPVERLSAASNRVDVQLDMWMGPSCGADDDMDFGSRNG